MRASMWRVSGVACSHAAGAHLMTSGSVGADWAGHCSAASAPARIPSFQAPLLTLPPCAQHPHCVASYSLTPYSSAMARKRFWVGPTHWPPTSYQYLRSTCGRAHGRGGRQGEGCKGRRDGWRQAPQRPSCPGVAGQLVRPRRQLWPHHVVVGLGQGAGHGGAVLEGDRLPQAPPAQAAARLAHGREGAGAATWLRGRHVQEQRTTAQHC